MKACVGLEESEMISNGFCMLGGNFVVLCVGEFIFLSIPLDFL